MATEYQKKAMRRYLRGYRYIEKELKARTEAMNDFLADIYNPLQGVALDGLPQGRGTVNDQTAAAVERIERSYKRILEEMERDVKRLQQRRDEINAAIAELPDSERCVMYFLYVKGVRWYDLPAYTRYEKTNNQRAETRALNYLIEHYGEAWGVLKEEKTNPF